MRNFRSTLFLSVVVLGLLAYFFLIDRHQKGTAEREKEETVLFGPSATGATSLKITGSDGAVVLDKKDGIWKIRQPISADADPAAVASVLRELQSLEARRVIQIAEIPHSDDTLQQWGLAPGNVRVDFSGPDFSATLLIGRKTAINDLVYARALHGEANRDAEAPVTLIPAESGDAIGKKLSDLRSRALLKGDLAKVTQLGIRIAPGTGTATAAVEYEIDRQGEAWKFQKPLAAAADDKKVVAWLGSLGKLRVKQFVSDDASNLSTYGLSSPASQFWVQSVDPKAPAQDAAKAPDTLLIGLPVPNTPGEVYAKRLADNAIVTLASADVDRLLHDLPEVRDRHVLAFDPDEVTGLRIEASHPKADGKDAKVRSESLIVAVQKKEKEDAWTFDPATVPPVSGNADPSRVKAFLGTLKDLEAAEIVSDTTSDLKPYGLDRPNATLTLALKKGDPNGTVSLLLGHLEKVPAPVAAASGAAPAAPVSAVRFYVKNSQEPFIYTVDGSFLDKLPRDSWSWLDPQITSTPPDQLKSLTVTPQNGAAFTVTRNQAGFQADSPAIVVDTAKANAQFSLAGNLRAVRWLGPPADAWGLARPQWTVKAEGAGAVPFTLLIGSILPDGGRAAQLAGAPFAFAISDADQVGLVTAPFAASEIRALPSPGSAPTPTPAP